MLIVALPSPVFHRAANNLIIVVPAFGYWSATTHYTVQQVITNVIVPIYAKVARVPPEVLLARNRTHIIHVSGRWRSDMSIKTRMAACRTSSYEYWIDSPPRLSSANLAILRHCPCPEQDRGQWVRSQADPEKPLVHWHLPVLRLHRPRFEHSASACAVFTAVASSLQASPVAQSRSEQSPPFHPSQHSHLYT